ncbi:MAG TPA: NAD(P)/FAD-dependent oxidoreductase [Spirochaetia bacterium]|nr:NAD(P)/FAD-dependent oxidoreductase [Spirochaetia bacterium]
MATTKRVVVLGGGYGGITVAKALHKQFRRSRDLEITLIDKNSFHTLMTELHEVAGGRVEPESVRVSFQKIFGGKRVRVVTDRIESIDFQGQVLKSRRSDYPYDYLVLGVGGEPEDYGIPGVKDFSFKLWSYDDAIKIREHIGRMFREAAKEPDAAKRRAMLTFVVGGAGFTGIEMAGELIEWKEKLAYEWGVDGSEVRVVVVEALSKICTILPDKLQAKTQRYMERHGTEFMLNSPISRVEPGRLVVNEKSGNPTVIETETFIWTCGIQGCEFAGNLSLTKGRCSNKLCKWATTQGTCMRKECEFAGPAHQYVDGKRGRLLVNDFLQSVDYENVYIVGDVAWYVEDKKVIPQIVETAVQTGECAAHNIIADLTGEEKRKFRSKYHGFMVSLGGRYGVANGMGASLSGIFAMGVKHLINLHYLLGLAGVNAVWGYLKHEFLDMRDRRTVIGGHVAEKVPIYWVAVLRVFLGVMWLLEGIGKIRDGWLNPSQIHIVPAAAKTVASAVAAGAQAAAGAASAAAAAAPQAVSGASEAAGTAAAAVAGAAQAAAAAGPVPLIAHPTGVYDWFVHAIVIHAPYLFQAGLVLGECAIGLALIGGLFTFLASAGSIALALVFILGAMADKSVLWFIAAAVVMLGGAGRGLGLDYWVMPWLQRWWTGQKIAHRTYLYLDEPRGVSLGGTRCDEKEAGK